MAETKGRQWEHFNHEADIGIRGYGADIEEAFATAALALTAVVTEPESVVSRERVVIEVVEQEPEWQLFEMINALVYEMSTRHMIFGEFNVRRQGRGLVIEALGENVDRARHQPAVEIKGATLTELSVKKTDRGWRAQCVVDV